MRLPIPIFILTLSTALAGCDGMDEPASLTTNSDETEYPVSVAYENTLKYTGEDVFKLVKVTADGKTITNYSSDESQFVLKQKNTPVFWEDILPHLIDAQIDFGDVQEVMVNERHLEDINGTTLFNPSFYYYNPATSHVLIKMIDCDSYMDCTEYGFLDSPYRLPSAAKIGYKSDASITKYYSDLGRSKPLSFVSQHWELKKAPQEIKTKQALLCQVTIGDSNDNGLMSEFCWLMDESGSVKPYSLIIDMDAGHSGFYVANEGS